MTATGSGDAAAARAAMVERQLIGRDISDPRVLEAMGTVAREEFVLPEYREYAYEDRPLPIGGGQTISQPYMVALTCQLAAVEPGARVLDIGSGSGYQAAVLAQLGAWVFGVELLPELVERSRASLARTGLAERVQIHHGDGTGGLPDHAPYDAILVAAAARRLPDALAEQVAPDGRIVAPVGSSRRQWLQVYRATPDGLEVTRVVPCRFVPLVGARRFGR